MKMPKFINFIVLALCCHIFINQTAAQTYQSNITIPVNAPVCLSYKPKNEIYKLRTYAVSKSIFKSPSYTPSVEVFGQIEDFKPWVNRSFLINENGESSVNGPSRHSIALLNPSIPVTIDFPYAFYKNRGIDYLGSLIASFCYPLGIIYNKTLNEVDVIYPLPTQISGDTPFQLSGMNARDFGYHYVYLDKSKSTYNVKFPQSSNMSTKIVSFRDFIHTGGSCKIKGGCNNLSPLQEELEYITPDIAASKGQKFTLYLKLWKNPPQSPSDKADLYEKIIFVKK